MVSKIFEAIYTKIFVNIVPRRSSTEVYIEVLNNKGGAQSDTSTFDTTSINEKMLNFIKKYIDETPYHYISIINGSKTQGAVPTCQNEEMGKYFDVGETKHICYKNMWSFYASTLELDSLQRKYAAIGLDFVFSPFMIVKNFFKDKIDGNLAMYILVQDDNLSLAVFKHSELIYAEHIDLDHSSESDSFAIDDVGGSDEDIDLGLDDDGIDLDDVSVMDDIEMLDDLGDIESLDSIEEIEEFSDSKDMEEELHDEAFEHSESSTSSTGFNDDYQRFSLIQSSVNDFYKDERYESQFIETVYIADASGISSDLKRYLEEEMFFNVYIRSIDLSVEICEAAKAELR